MSVVLNVNGRDLAQYARPWAEDGFSMDPEAIDDPQFAGSPAFTEGLRFTEEASGNRHWQVPLVLDADSRAELHELVRDINGDLFRGAEVEFASDSADSSTFFDLEAGRLDVTYDYMLTAVNNITRATLHLWTRPFGYSKPSGGTIRLVASAIASGPVEIPATGILGDVDARVNLRFRATPHMVVEDTPVVMYGVHRSASFIAVLHAASHLIDSVGNGTVIGASGAIASQYVGFPVSPTRSLSNLDQFAFHRPSPAAPYIDERFRVFGVVRSRIAVPSAAGGALGLRLRGRWEDVFTPTVLATHSTEFGLYDFGEVTFPNAIEPADQDRLKLDWISGGASGASIIASPGLHVQALIYLPLGYNAGIFVDDALLDHRVHINNAEEFSAYKTEWTSSTWEENITTEIRGDPPTLPPVGSPGASGPARFFALVGEQSGFLGNRLLEIDVRARERFRFLK